MICPSFFSQVLPHSFEKLSVQSSTRDMAGLSARYLGACKNLLIPLMLLSIFRLMQCRNLNKFSVNEFVGQSLPHRPRLGLRIDLVHRDSLLSPISPGNISSIERLKRAIERSQDRLEKLQMSAGLKSVKLGGQVKDVQAPVSAGNGEFLMQLAIGKPSLAYSAILDTGSDLTWTQCMPCSDCYKQPTPIYDPSLSSTYGKVRCNNPLCQSFSCSNSSCNYGYSYGDSSFTKGILSYETFTLSSRKFSPLVFGCGHNNSGVAFGQGGGLVGFGRGPLSLVSQLGKSRGNKFSYCLVSVNDSPSKTSTLLMGKHTKMNAATVSSTPIIQSSLNPTYYYLSLEGISVNDNLLKIPAGTFDIQSDGSGGLIIDSGTTVTYLKQNVYDAVKEALNSSINLPNADGSSVGLDLCFQQGSSNSSFPTVIFHFKGADFVLSKDNYLFDIGNGVLCLTMLSNGGITDLSIFGNLQQQNYQILYDNGSNMLSFAPTVCGTL